MSRRVYIGRLPPDVTAADVERHFGDVGKIVDTRLMGQFGFLEFASSREAEDVIAEFNGKEFLGSNIIVEAAKESRRRDVYEGAPRERPARGGGGRGVRVLVKGISTDVSWQDLKDFGREGGPVTFADVDRYNPGQGVLEYPTLDDANAAVKTLLQLELRGARPDVIIDDSPAPPPREYDDRRDRGGYGGGYGGGGGGYGGGYRDDRDRRPPPRDDYYRRDRSPRRDYRDRSPPRYDDRRRDRSPPARRERSPPPRSRDPRDARDDYRPRDRSPRRDYDRRDERGTTERAPDTRAAPLRGEGA